MPGLRFVEQFFAARTSPRRLGLFRAAVGTVGLLAALVTRRELGTLFRADALRVPQFAWLPSLQPAYSDAYVGLWILASVLFAIGLFTRTAGTIVAVCILYRFALDLTLYTTNIYLCGLLTVLLVVGDSGTAISLDEVRGGRRNRLILLWPQILLKLQISLVYLFTAIEKINPRFLAGDIFKGFLSLPGFADDPWVYHAAAAATILLELFLAGGLWSRRFRGWAFLLGFAFHLLIPLVIGLVAALIAYSAMFVGSYLLFLDEHPGSRLISGSGREICWLRRLDWLRIHRYEPVSGPLSLETDRGRFTGWAAFKEVLSVVPAGFFWASALSLPLIGGLGRAAYGEPRRTGPIPG